MSTPPAPAGPVLKWKDNPTPTGEIITSTAWHNDFRYEAIKLIAGGFTLDVSNPSAKNITFENFDFKSYPVGSIAEAKALAEHHAAGKPMPAKDVERGTETPPDTTPPPPSAPTHAFLVEKAAAWLAAQSCAVVITEMASAGGETPDAIGWAQRGNSILIEVKISRADFLADRFKAFRRDPWRGMGSLRYYCAPAGLLTAQDLPTGWGLLEWNGKKLLRRVKATGGHTPATQALALAHIGSGLEICLLLSALRRIGQTCPPGISIKAYTLTTQNKATLGVQPLPEPP